MPVVLHSTVVMQYVDLVVAVAAADVIVIPEMIAVGHVLLAVATDTMITDAVAVAIDTHNGTAGVEAVIDVVLPVGHLQNQRTSRSS